MGWLETESRNDNEFGKVMNPHVWNGVFGVALRNFHEDEELDYMKLGRSINKEIYFPDYMTVGQVIPSRFQFDSVCLKIGQASWKHGIDKDNKALRAFFSAKAAGSTRSPLQLFRDLEGGVDHSSLDLEGKSWTFDTLIAFLSSFYVLSPMTNPVVEMGLLHRLERSGAKLPRSQTTEFSHIE